MVFQLVASAPGTQPSTKQVLTNMSVNHNHVINRTVLANWFQLRFPAVEVITLGARSLHSLPQFQTNIPDGLGRIHKQGSKTLVLFPTHHPPQNCN